MINFERPQFNFFQINHRTPTKFPTNHPFNHRSRTAQSHQTPTDSREGFDGHPRCTGQQACPCPRWARCPKCTCARPPATSAFCCSSTASLVLFYLVFCFCRLVWREAAADHTVCCRPLAGKSYRVWKFIMWPYACWTTPTRKFNIRVVQLSVRLEFRNRNGFSIFESKTGCVRVFLRSEIIDIRLLFVVSERFNRIITRDYKIFNTQLLY